MDARDACLNIIIIIEMMEGEGSRAEVVSNMRQNRIQKLMMRLKQEGIEVEDALPFSSDNNNTNIFKLETSDNAYPQTRSDESHGGGMQSKGQGRVERSKSHKSKRREMQVDEEQDEEYEEEARKLGVFPATAYTHQTKFYDSAMDSHKRKMVIDSALQQDIKNKANSKKMNKNSEKILLDKQEQNLMMAIISVCPESDDLVSYEKLGRILYLMSIFNVIKFDEKCEVILDEDSPDRSHNIQKYQEVD